MYESKLLRFREMPVFSLSDLSQVVSGKVYAKKLARRLVDSGEIRKIMRDFYTFHDDAFLVSTFLMKPSYVTSVSALSYHRLITQIPKDVFCCTQKKSASISFGGSEIRFFGTNRFFGFSPCEYNGFKVPIAEPEKAVADSIGIVPLSIVEEALGSIGAERMVSCIRKTKKGSIAKRLGFLLERSGFDAYGELRPMVNRRYLLLDPLARKSGKKDRKWGLVVNA